MRDREQQRLLKSKKVKIENTSSLIIFKFLTWYDYYLLVIGLLGTAVFSFCPLFLLIKCGQIMDEMEDNNGDLSEFYDSEKELAYECYMLAVVSIITGWIGAVSFIKFGSRQGLFWKQAYFKAITNRPVKWFDKRNPAEMGTGIDIDCNSIEIALGEKIMLLLSAVIFHLSAWVLSFNLCVELTLVYFGLVLMGLFGGQLVERASVKSVKMKSELYATAGGIAEESFEGVKTIASINAQEARARRYQTELKPLKRVMLLNSIFLGLGWGILFFGSYLFVGIDYYYGAYLHDKDEETWNGSRVDASTIQVICFSISLSALYVNTCLPSVAFVQAGFLSASKMHNIIARGKKHDGSKKITDCKGIIDFENVSFNYPGKPEVNILRGISLHVDSGDSLAIVGETGSGKSTIIQLIEGFYYAQLGTVKIDGIDIREYDISELRKFMSLVNQEPILFNGSISENIRIGKENATDDEVRLAAKIVEANSFIENLPQKYETWVGVKGSLLSGGQKQRISLARAIIRSPKILLLDEATSALDMNTEKLIQQTIEEIIVGITTITVAQRLSTVKNCRKIIVLKNGEIVEAGAFKELVAANKFFGSMLNIQNIEEKSYSAIQISETSENIPETTQINKEKQSPKVGLKVFVRIISMLRKYWAWVLLAFCSAVLAGSTIPIFSYFLGDDANILMGFQDGDIVDQTRTNMFFIIGTSTAMLVGLTLMSGSLGKIASSCTYELRYLSLFSMLNYDQRFFDKPESSPAWLSFSLVTDCENVSSLGGPVVGLHILVYSSIIGGMIIAFIYDVTLSLVLFSFLPFMGYSAAKGETLSMHGMKNTKAKQTSAIASDTFTNIKTVQAFNREEYFYRKYIELSQEVNAGAMKGAHVNSIIFGSRFFMLYLILGTLAWFGSYRVKEGEMPMEDMLQSFFCVLLTYIGFILMGAFSPNLKVGIKSGKRLFKALDYCPAINVMSSEGSFDPIIGCIEFKKVDFSYENRDISVLNSISFYLESGCSLGITGTTGSGKSTIAQLLLRFYDPTAGEILLDSVPLKDYNLRHLRDSISWVGQEPILFLGSIFYNLQIARADITEKEAIEALSIAQALDIIEKYGLECDVGLRGYKLSGGQKQRIAIARAIARRPKVLVFDEATSALDNITESRLMERLKNEKCTVIAIAHRLQSIKDYQQIILIEKGTLVEKGNHEDLMKIENGYYRELFLKST